MDWKNIQIVALVILLIWVIVKHDKLKHDAVGRGVAEIDHSGHFHWKPLAFDANKNTATIDLSKTYYP